ncbi:MAG: cyanophycinase, partial [Hymenobacter sp.]
MPTPTPKGCLLAIGGHERRSAPNQQGSSVEQSADFILQRFVDELKGERTIVIIPTASEEADEAAKAYIESFTALGV